MAEPTSQTAAAKAEIRETAAEKAAITRKTNATKRSTTAKKAAGTRAANRGAAARSTAASKTKASATRARTTAARQTAQAKQEVKGPMERAAGIAETAVLVPVGAALIARDEVMSTIESLRSKFGTRAKAERELRRFERRGSTAMKRIERDAKKTRTRVEREMRERRARIEKDLRVVANRTEPMAKNVELVTARLENAYEGGRTAVTKASTTVQERIASLA
ncbi:MAG: hypothetical protein QOH83_732 [Solirubrobacteraceae bacterium]|jgi:hypothetical protein|nr:hypothetical protein [Solirubrobacteraceae bacterium]